jgi:hypothetical protein
MLRESRALFRNIVLRIRQIERIALTVEGSLQVDFVKAHDISNRIILRAEQPPDHSACQPSPNSRVVIQIHDRLLFQPWRQ